MMTNLINNDNMKDQQNTWNERNAINDEHLFFGKYGMYVHILNALITVSENFARLSPEEKSSIIKNILDKLRLDISYKIDENVFEFICEWGDDCEVKEGIKKLIVSNAKWRVLICNNQSGTENLSSVIQEQINNSAMQQGESILCVAYHWLYPDYMFRVFTKN